MKRVLALYRSSYGHIETRADPKEQADCDAIIFGMPTPFGSMRQYIAPGPDTFNGAPNPLNDLIAASGEDFDTDTNQYIPGDGTWGVRKPALPRFRQPYPPGHPRRSGDIEHGEGRF